MCGIAGLVDWENESSIESLKNLTDALSHRGPDDSDYLFESHGSVQIGLGHRRLSILDLSPLGRQPMTYQNLTMVFNGEVYNFREIRQELMRKGYSFDGNSDSEVVLKSLHFWGVDAVKRFNGMFAIGLYNRLDNSLILIRDRAGVKPIYWSNFNGLFMFASELKSFHTQKRFEKRINRKALRGFFKYGYIQEPLSIFENTFKLRAGHHLKVDLISGKIKEIKYWDVVDYYNKPRLVLDEREILDRTENLLISACNYRMVSDVPVGIFLSGGYDSSAVTALIQNNMSSRVKTFAIGFEDRRFNEADHARRVADHLGTDHYEYICTQKDALRIIPKISEIWDEPFGDVSAVPTTLVSELAKEQVTVSLSADGGDEVFGGYTKYEHVLNFEQVRRYIPLKSSLARLLSSPSAIKLISSISRNERTERRINKTVRLLNSKGPLDTLELISSAFLDIELDKLFKDKSIDSSLNLVSFGKMYNSKMSSLDMLLSADYKTYQQDNILTKVDRATMSVSLEGREPLLDYRLVEHMAQVDSNYKIRNGEKKYLLKEITHKYIPKEIMNRPKMGFGVPIQDWFRDELKELLCDYLSEEMLKKSDILDVDYVSSLRDKYIRGDYVNISQIWYLLIFQMWFEKWME